jgi:hypothetical protein
VVDATGKTQNKTLEPGVGASVYGKPPFKVLTGGLNQVDMYKGLKNITQEITWRQLFCLFERKGKL